MLDLARIRRDRDSQVCGAIGQLVVGLEKRDKQQQERRRYRRFNVGVKVHLCARRDNGQYDVLCEAWAVDISMGGIGFLIDRALGQEDHYFISFGELIHQPCYAPVHVSSARVLFGNVRQIHGAFVYQEDRGGTDGPGKDGVAEAA